MLSINCPQIWNIEKGKDRDKEKVVDRPAKLNEKNSDRELEREIKNRGNIFGWKNNIKKFCSGEEEMRNPSGHQCKLKMRGSKKKK